MCVHDVISSYTFYVDHYSQIHQHTSSVNDDVIMPVDLAAMLGHLEIVELLQSKGAKDSHKCKSHTPHTHNTHTHTHTHPHNLTLT